MKTYMLRLRGGYSISGSSAQEFENNATLNRVIILGNGGVKVFKI